MSDSGFWTANKNKLIDACFENQFFRSGTRRASIPSGYVIARNQLCCFHYVFDCEASTHLNLPLNFCDNNRLINVFSSHFGFINHLLNSLTLPTTPAVAMKRIASSTDISISTTFSRDIMTVFPPIS